MFHPDLHSFFEGIPATSFNRGTATADLESDLFAALRLDGNLIPVSLG